MKRHVETSIRNQISLTTPISSYAGPKKKLNFLSNFTKIRTNFKRENKKYFLCRNPGLIVPRFFLGMPVRKNSASPNMVWEATFNALVFRLPRPHSVCNSADPTSCPKRRRSLFYNESGIKWLMCWLVSWCLFPSFLRPVLLRQAVKML